jgi:hypothetical protein
MGEREVEHTFSNGEHTSGDFKDGVTVVGGSVDEKV